MAMRTKWSTGLAILAISTALACATDSRDDGDAGGGDGAGPADDGGSDGGTADGGTGDDHGDDGDPGDDGGDDGDPGDDGGAYGDDCSTDDDCEEIASCDRTVGQCRCHPGWEMAGGSCQLAGFVDPADRTEDEVCDMYRFAIVDNDPMPYSQSADMCQLGTMTRDGYNDAYRRINFYRWLSGTAPVTRDFDLDVAYSLGCLMNVVNGTTTYGYSSSMQCYDARVGPAGSARGMQVGQKTAAAGIWSLFNDSGSDAWVNHRQPIVSHYAKTVGIGFATDSRAPSYDSITIHGTGELGGTLPQGSPGFYTVPNHGFVPLAYAELSYWSVHAPLSSPSEGASRFIDPPTVTVLEDGTEIPDGLVPVRGAPYPEILTDTLVLERGDWTVKSGSTYSVTVVAAETFEFDVTPVDCQ